MRQKMLLRGDFDKNLLYFQGCSKSSGKCYLRLLAGYSATGKGFEQIGSTPISCELFSIDLKKGQLTSVCADSDNHLSECYASSNNIEGNEKLPQICMLTPIPESFTIVIPGSWNAAIFSSRWIAEHLLKDSDSRIEVAMNLGDLNQPPRIKFEECFLYPSATTLSLSAIESSVASLVNAARVTRQILQLLEHTPVSALGINFGFHDDSDEVDFANRTKSLDADQLAKNYQIKTTSIKRELSLETDMSLIFSITQLGTGVQYDFNFHHASDSRSAYLGFLDETNVQKCSAVVDKILKGEYGYEY